MSSLIGGWLQQLIQGKPDEIPKPPAYTPPPIPPPPKKILAPSGLPTEDKTQSNAYKADERRRILGNLPSATKDVYAGADTTNPNLKKPKLLGGGVGQQTSGV
jgi:hypothetical protein